MNTKIKYLYRDADNYKIGNECIINGVLSEGQKKSILDCLHEGEFFIPNKVGMPELRFDKWNSKTDHIWFEMSEDAFSLTDSEPTLNYSAEELVNLFLRCKGKWEEEIGISIENAKSLFSGSLEWTVTDPDCVQVRRAIDTAYFSKFELAQIDTLELFDKNIYNIAQGDVDISEYTEKEIDVILRSYGYKNMEQLTELLGSKAEAMGQLAEMIFETYSSDYYVDRFSDWNSAVECIEEYTKQDLEEYKQQKDMMSFSHLSSFIYTVDTFSNEEERFSLGMIASDGTTYYISEKYGDIIRGTEMTVDSAIQRLGTPDYLVIGGYAENGLFFIYDGEGNIGEDDLKILLSDNPVFISDVMKANLDLIRSNEKRKKESLDDKLNSALEKKSTVTVREKSKENDFHI